MVTPPLDQLISLYVTKLYESAQIIENTVNDYGLVVNLEKNRSKGAKLITTAEAICALAPHRKINSQRFENLVNGLNYLYKDHIVNERPIHNRHLGWYTLAMVEADHTDYLKPAFETLIDNATKSGCPFDDDPSRLHEVYSTWIVTWALLSAIDYFRDRNQPNDVAVKLANEGVNFLINCLRNNSEYGAPFTKVQIDRHFHESQPNPAMTAYVLSLIPIATKVLGISLSLDFQEIIQKSYDTLAKWENNFIWDSYREPYRPNSSEGDFEHFTTCWVARAFWSGLSSADINADDALKRNWLWTLSKAMRGLIHNLRVQSVGYEGLIYVDRGSLRDYSFAISDFLMFLNVISKERLSGIQSNSVHDDILERLLKNSEIDILIQDVSSLSELSSAYNSFQIITQRLSQEAQKTGAEIARLTNQTEILSATIITKENRNLQLRDEIQLLTETRQNLFNQMNERLGLSLNIFHFDWLDFVTFILSLFFILFPIANLTSARPIGDKFIAFLIASLFYIGVVATAYIGTSMISDIYFLFTFRLKTKPLNWALSFFGLVSVIMLFTRFILWISDSNSPTKDFFGGGAIDIIFAPIVGGIIKFVYDRSKKKWTNFQENQLNNAESSEN